MWEIDALRGLAIVWMVAFHASWDWAYFNGGSLGPHGPYFSGIIGGTFITLLGISLSLDRERLRAAGRSLPARTARRLALIGGAAALVSLGSWLALPEAFIYFGILHLLAVSTLLVALTARLGAVVNALIGATILAIGWSGLLDGAAPGPLLSLLGWSAPRATLDWYPLAPWSGFAFLGYAVGQVCYPGGRRRFAAPPWRRHSSGLRVLGRHSLPIYLAHQLLLFPLVWALVAILS